MENNELLLNKSRNLADDPQFFGSFFNMARLNVLIINNHLADIFEKTKLKDDQNIADSFLANKNIKDLSWYDVYKKEAQFLKIIKFLTEEDRTNTEKKELVFDVEEVLDTLKEIFLELNRFRNDYTHFATKEASYKRKTNVNAKVATFIQNSFLQAIQLSKKRHHQTLSEEDYKLVAEKKIFENDLSHTLTTDGLVFFINMFLEPEQAFLMMNQIRGFKGTHAKEFLATRYVFTEYCLKLPHDRFISIDNKDSLALDMLNELGKCPKELYNVLAEKEKQKFLPNLEDEAAQNILKNSLSDTIGNDIDYDDFIQQKIKKVRHKNRFHYHALSYIDSEEVLGKYRFQIALGELEIKRYLKTIGGQEIDRVITKPLSAFGKLIDFQNENEILAKLPNTKFKTFHPHYKMCENKIAIYDKNKAPYTENEKIKQTNPKAFLSLHELPKILLLDYLKKGRPAELIDQSVKSQTALNENFIENIKTILPKWEPFHMRFHPYPPKEADELKQRKIQLNEVLAKEGKTIKQIPSKIIYYWLNIKENRKATKDFIKSMLQECKQRSKEIQNYLKGEKNKVPKQGEMATFIAKDFIHMLVSKETKGRLTPPYYNELQRCLALYNIPQYKEQFLSIIQELNLNKEEEHPFLKECNCKKLHNTFEFYTRYLAEKQKWIDKTFYHRRGRNVDIYIHRNALYIPYTITKRGKTKKNFQDWKECLTSKVLNLSTDLFDSELIKALQQELDKNNISYSPTNSWNKLFKIWWEMVRDDDTQAFYNANRTYTIYEEEVNFTPHVKKQYKDYYQSIAEKVFKNKRKENKKLQRKQVEHVFRKTISGTEKLLRLTQEEDRIILLLLSNLFKDPNIKLQNYNTLLESQVELREQIRGKIIYEKGELGDKEERKTGQIYKTIVGKRKRKDNGALKKYRYNKPLIGYFEYYSGEEITEEEVKKELRSYHQYKQIVFDKTFKLEKAIIQKDRTSIEQLEKRNNHIRFSTYIQWLKEKQIISNTDGKLLTEIRNTFSHNQYPRKEITKFVKTTEVAKEIAYWYVKQINTTIEKIGQKA